MTGDCHVRFSESRGVRLPPATQLRYSPSVRDELDFVAVVVLEIGGVVVGAAGEGMPVAEHELPAVLTGTVDQMVEGAAGAGVKGEVVELGSAPLVGTPDQRSDCSSTM